MKDKVNIYIKCWIAGIGFLSAYINVTGLLDYSYSLSHYTGNLIDVIVSVMHHEKRFIIPIITLLFICFIAGGILAALINKKTEFTPEPKYGYIMLCIGLITGCAFFIDHRGSIYLLSLVLGMQNALIHSYRGMSFKITHVTGNLSDLGSNLGHFLSGHQSFRWRFIFDFTLIATFALGTIAGVFFYTTMGRLSYLLVGGLYFISAFFLFRIRVLWKSAGQT